MFKPCEWKWNEIFESRWWLKWNALQSGQHIRVTSSKKIKIKNGHIDLMYLNYIHCHSRLELYWMLAMHSFLLVRSRHPLKPAWMWSIPTPEFFLVFISLYLYSNIHTAIMSTQGITHTQTAILGFKYQCLIESTRYSNTVHVHISTGHSLTS